MAAEVSLHDLRETILRAIAAEGESLKKEIRRVQKDMVLILSKLPGGDSGKSPREISDDEEGPFACAGLGGDPDGATEEKAAKPVSSCMATGGRPSVGSRASPASVSPLAASISRGRSRAEDLCEADAPSPRRDISGELHMSEEPAPAQCMQRPTARTSRRFRVSMSSRPAAGQPPQVVSDTAPDSVLPRIAPDSWGSSRFSPLGASSDERHSRSRSGALRRKLGKAERSANLSGRRTHPVSEVPTVTFNSKRTQKMTTSYESSSKSKVEELSSEEEKDLGEPPESELASTTSRKSGGASKLSLECSLARLCGLLPWSTRRTWLAWLYQQLFLVVAVAVATAFAWWLKEEIVAGQVHSATTSEVLLALGSALGLLSCKVHRSSESLVEAEALLRKWISSYDLSPSRRCILSRDVGCSLLLWFAAVGVHAGITVVDDPDERMCQVFAFGVASLLQTALASLIVYKCNCLLAILDHFSDTTAASKDFTAAAFRWHRVRATCQSVCRSIQACFAILVTAGALGVLAVVRGLSAGDAFPSAVPGLVLHLASLRILVYAAMVSDCCERVPVLVNSVNTGRTLDPTRITPCNTSDTAKLDSTSLGCASRAAASSKLPTFAAQLPLPFSRTATAAVPSCTELAVAASLRHSDFDVQFWHA